MHLDRPLRGPQSRRRFLRSSGASVAGGSALLLGGCTDDTKNPVKTGPDESDQADAELISGVLDLELRTIAAYKAGAGRLRGSALALAKAFVEQEQAHADAWTGAITELGERPDGAKGSYDFPPLRTQAQVLRFLLELENVAIAEYIDLLPKLTQTDLRATAASIITTEAEHVSVLLEALGRDPVPGAFVTGSAP